MSFKLRPSFFSRRIIHRAFVPSKSCKESKSQGPPVLCNIVNLGGDEKRGENGDDDNVRRSGLRRQHGVVSSSAESQSESESNSWANMLPELLGEIMQRVEANEDQWPMRRNVVACACVCKRWREAVTEVVEKGSLHQPGKITFPSSLKQVPFSVFLFSFFFLISFSMLMVSEFV